MSRIKSWKGQIQKCKDKASRLRKQLLQIEKELSYNERKARELQEKVDKLNSQEIEVSEHAVKRYRERFDPEATREDVEKALITEELKYLVGVLGEGEFPIDLDSQIKVVINDRVILTTY